MPAELTHEDLVRESGVFAGLESGHADPALYGVTDGKAVGTYWERKFRVYLGKHYQFETGSASLGIDLPGLNVDIKTTSVDQPQSSCPFESAWQKIYGLGYGLLIFVYDKLDDHQARTGCLNIQHIIHVEKEQTADFQMTRGIREILDRGGNEDDLIGFFADRNLPVDDIEGRNLAREIMKKRPLQGYLTISNALQWRLQYGRIIDQAGMTNGIQRIR